MSDQKEKHPPAAPPVTADAVARRTAAPEGRIQPAHLYRAAWLGFALLLLLRYFEPVSRFLLITYAAAILAVGLNALARRVPLERRWLAAAIGLSGVGVLAALLTLGVPLLVAQARSLVEMGPQFAQQVEQWEGWLRERTGIRVELERLLRNGQSMLSGGNLVGSATTAVEVILVPLIVFAGGLFALASPNERLLNPVLRIVHRDVRPAVYRIFQLLAERLLGWLKGTALAMLVVGLLSSIAFWIIGVPNALFLGVLNGVLEFVPLIGPFVGGGAAVLVALLEDPSKAPWVALAALAIQQLEGNVITPLVMASEAKVHPFITLFALVLFGSLFGLLGMLLAVPLVLLVWTVVQVLWVERALDTDRDAIAPVVNE